MRISLHPSPLPRLLLGLIVTAAAWSGEAAPVQIADLNTAVQTSYPSRAVTASGITYLSLTSEPYGAELWRTDGTPNGTVLVADIKPGQGGSVPGQMTAFAGKLFFSATNTPSGFELWSSDGTAAGTVQVKEIMPNNGSSTPSGLTVSNNTLFFAADDGSSGRELWVSDGTTAGTVRVIDLAPGAASAAPSQLVAFGSGVAFVANDGSSGAELWISNGTPAGTVRVADLVAGAGSPAIGNLRSIDGKLYFQANVGGTGAEPWVSDGTAAGTFSLGDLAAGAGSSSPGHYVSIGGGQVLFAATTPAAGTELWVTSGTAATTALVKDIQPGTGSSTPNNLITVGARAAFAATTSSGTELWVSDGTAAGTVQVKDINPGANSSTPNQLVLFASGIAFLGNSGAAGPELMRSDLTAAGTVLVRDLVPGTAGPSIDNLSVSNGRLYCGATTPDNGHEPWTSDGTNAGTISLGDIAPGNQSSHPAEAIALSPTQTLFAAASATSGRELYATNGTTAALVADLNPGANASSPTGFVRLGNRVLFQATSASAGAELWSSDGTAAGTQQLIDINPGTGSSSPSNLVVLGNQILFSADDGSTGAELWVSDGTALGTARLRDINAGSLGSTPSSLLVCNGRVFFAATSADAGSELWTSDGTVAGTVRVNDIVPGSTGSTPSLLTALGNRVAFVATTAASGAELWISDGTAGGTLQVADIRPGASGAAISGLVAWQDRVWFAANNGTSGSELWSSDGTTVGTTQVADLAPGSGWSSPASLTVVGNRLAFRASTAAAGTELWSTDGTAAGTTLVSDIASGSANGLPYNFLVSADRLWFQAWTADTGAELWVSDLTSGGTTRVADLFPGMAGSQPMPLLVTAAGDLLFSASDGQTGQELWRVQTTLGTLAVAVTPAPGDYPSEQTVTASCATAGAVIRYRSDSSDPTAADPIFPAAGLPITQNTTLRLRAFRTGWMPSPVVTAAYTLTVTQPTISPAGGLFNAPVAVTLACATPGVDIRFTLDGSVPTVTSPIYTVPLQLSQSATVRAIATRSGWTDSAEATTTYTIDLPRVATIALTPATASVPAGGTAIFSTDIRDQFGAPIVPTQPLSWTVTPDGAGTIVDGTLVVTSNASGVVAVTASADGISGSAIVTIVPDDGGEGGGGDPPAPVAPTVTLIVTGGLTGDETGTHNGESVSFTNRSSVTVTVTANGGVGTLSAVEITGGSETLRLGQVGEITVPVGNGRSLLRATVTVTSGSASASASSPGAVVIADDEAPEVVCYLPSRYASNGAGRQPVPDGILGLNAESDSDNNQRRTQWGWNNFNRDDAGFEAAATDDQGLLTDTPVVVEAIGNSMRVLPDASVQVAPPGAESAITMTGFDALPDSATYDGDGRGTTTQGLYALRMRVTDRCGNVAERDVAQLLVKTQKPHAQMAVMPYGGNLRSLVPLTGSEVTLSPLRYVLADGDARRVVVNNVAWTGLYGYPTVLGQAGDRQPPGIFRGALELSAVDSTSCQLVVYDYAGNKREVTCGPYTLKRQEFVGANGPVLTWERGKFVWTRGLVITYYGSGSSQQEAIGAAQGYSSDDRRFFDWGNPGPYRNYESIYPWVYQGRNWAQLDLYWDRWAEVMNLKTDLKHADSGIIVSEMPEANSWVTGTFEEYGDLLSFTCGGATTYVSSFKKANHQGPYDLPAQWWMFAGDNMYSRVLVQAAVAEEDVLMSHASGRLFESAHWADRSDYPANSIDRSYVKEFTLKRFDEIAKQRIDGYGTPTGLDVRQTRPVLMARPSWRTAAVGSQRKLAWLVETSGSMTVGSTATIGVEGDTSVTLNGAGVDELTRAHAPFSATMPELYPGWLEWTQRANYKLDAKHLVGTIDRSDFRKPADDQRTEVTDDSMIADDRKWPAAMPVIRSVGIAPDVLVSGGQEYTLKPTGDILAIAFFNGQDNITVPLATYESVRGTDQEYDTIKNRIAITDITTRSVVLTREYDQDPQPTAPERFTYQVIESITVRVGPGVPGGLIDLRVLLLPEPLDFRYNGARGQPDDIARTFTGGNVVAAHAYPDELSQQYAGANGAHRMKEALAVVKMDCVVNDGTGAADSLFVSNSRPVPSVTLTVDSLSVNSGKVVGSYTCTVEDYCSSITITRSKVINSISVRGPAGNSVSKALVESVPSGNADPWIPYPHKGIASGSFEFNLSEEGEYVLSVLTGENTAGMRNGVDLPIVVRKKTVANNYTLLLDHNILPTTVDTITLIAASGTSYQLLETLADSNIFAGVIDMGEIGIQINGYDGPMPTVETVHISVFGGASIISMSNIIINENEAAGNQYAFKVYKYTNELQVDCSRVVSSGGSRGNSPFMVRYSIPSAIRKDGNTCDFWGKSWHLSQKDLGDGNYDYIVDENDKPVVFISSGYAHTDVNVRKEDDNRHLAFALELDGLGRISTYVPVYSGLMIVGYDPRGIIDSHISGYETNGYYTLGETNILNRSLGPDGKVIGTKAYLFTERTVSGGSVDIKNLTETIASEVIWRYATNKNTLTKFLSLKDFEMDLDYRVKVVEKALTAKWTISETEAYRDKNWNPTRAFSVTSAGSITDALSDMWKNPSGYATGCAHGNRAVILAAASLALPEFEEAATRYGRPYLLDGNGGLVNGPDGLPIRAPSLDFVDLDLVVLDDKAKTPGIFTSYGTYYDENWVPGDYAAIRNLNYVKGSNWSPLFAGENMIYVGASTSATDIKGNFDRGNTKFMFWGLGNKPKSMISWYTRINGWKSKDGTISGQARLDPVRIILNTDYARINP